MFRNYLKLAVRNLSRQKAFSIINIAGLAIGLASSLTILLWVQDELSYDRFHSKADRTYRLTAGIGNLKVAISPGAAGAALKEAIPEIVHQTSVYPERGVMLQKGEIKFQEQNLFYAEPTFFDVFDIELVHGDKKTALSDLRSVVISEETAIKYFGTTDAMGEVITKGGNEQFTVTGIFSKPKERSHLDIDIMLPWAHLETWNNNLKSNRWSNFDFYTYVVFDTPKDEAFIAGVNKKMAEMYQANQKDIVDIHFWLQPLTDIHLHSQLMAEVSANGNYQYVAALTIIAVFIVLIGCINFMNLSTARSARRAKEVGLRKVAGAMRLQLVKQFLGESALVTFLSLVIALIVVAIALPRVNDLIGKQLSLDLADPRLILGIAAVAIVTGLLAGIYPALVLSGFAPIKVLKKDVKGGAGGSVFRNVLVVTQFSISIILLVGTTIVYNQLNFIRTRDIGYQKENLIYTKIHGWDKDRFARWKAAFRAHPETENVTISNDLPTNLVSGTGNITWQGKDPNKQIMMATLFIDDDFIPVYGMQLAAGRNYNKDIRGDSSSYLINEAAATAMGFTPESAIGQEIEMWSTRGPIIGVIKDFNFKPLRTGIEPMIIRPNDWGNTVIVKAEPGKIRETIAVMEEVWKSNEGLYPFTYGFIDQDLENLYRSEKEVGTLFSAFALLAIFISCLGLYGLSAYIAEQRTREIGIRKALGASVSSIVYLLATRFVIPVVVAMMIAAPIALYTMNQWLNGFAYKIGFNWLFVVGAGALALFISLATVSFESLKAARVNPVKSLRSE